MGNNNGVICLFADKEWVQFGFFNGAKLLDPQKKLEGQSNYIRHIKVRSPGAIDRAYLIDLLNQAVKTYQKAISKNRNAFEGLPSYAGKPANDRSWQRQRI